MSQSVAPTSKALTYSTTTNSVRLADSFVCSGQNLDLPAIGLGIDSQIISGSDEAQGAADARSLAVHPGYAGSWVGAPPPSVNTLLEVRFSPTGPVQFSGAVTELGAHCGGVDVWVYAGPSLVTSTTALNTDAAWSFASAVATSGVIRVFIGPGSDFSCDHSQVSLTVSPPPPVPPSPSPPSPSPPPPSPSPPTTSSPLLPAAYPEDPNAWYCPGAFDLASGTWQDCSGNGNTATLSGSGLAESRSAGHGATSEVLALAGTTSSAIAFGAVIKSAFTVCSVTRYTGGAKGRILDGGAASWPGSGAGWLHGHHGGNAGVTFYGGWKTSYQNNVSPNTDWLVMCGTNAGSQLLVNGADIGTWTGGRGGVSLFVNAWGEKSNFAIAEVVVWPRGLTDDEMRGVSEHLMNRLG